MEVGSPNVETVLPERPAGPGGAPIPNDLRVGGPWARYWARMLDVTVFSVALAIPMGFLTPGLFAPGGPFASGGGTLVLGFLLLPFALMLEACAYAAFGNSPGKAILGLKALTVDGRKLSFGQVLARIMRVYVAGLGLGIPLVSLFTLLRSHRKVSSGELTSWDASLNTRTMSPHGSTLRTWFGGFAYIALFIGFGAAGALAPMVSEHLRAKASGSRAEVTVEERVAAEASALNKKLPMRIDDATQLVEAVAGPGRRFRFVMVLEIPPGMESAEVADAIQGEMASTIRRNVCKNADLEPFRSGGVAFIYSYVDKARHPLGEVMVLPGDCP